MTPTRDSICRICGDRLSYLNSEKKIEWKPGSADDEGLVCGQCIAIAKLQRMRKEKEEGP